MKKTPYTNEDVFLYGCPDASWPVDINPITGETESNGGIEVIYEMPDEKRYTIIVDWAKENVYQPNQTASEYNDEE